MLQDTRHVMEHTPLHEPQRHLPPFMAGRDLSPSMVSVTSHAAAKVFCRLIRQHNSLTQTS